MPQNTTSWGYWSQLNTPINIYRGRFGLGAAFGAAAATLGLWGLGSRFSDIHNFFSFLVLAAGFKMQLLGGDMQINEHNSFHPNYQISLKLFKAPGHPKFVDYICMNLLCWQGNLNMPDGFPPGLPDNVQVVPNKYPLPLAGVVIPIAHQESQLGTFLGYGVDR